jgi:hypothetical protein
MPRVSIIASPVHVARHWYHTSFSMVHPPHCSAWAQVVAPTLSTAALPNSSTDNAAAKAHRSFGARKGVGGGVGFGVGGAGVGAGVCNRQPALYVSLPGQPLDPLQCAHVLFVYSKSRVTKNTGMRHNRTYKAVVFGAIILIFVC